MTPEALLKQRERRHAEGNATTKRYERTKNGKLMRNYRNMESRVKGIQKKKSHLYYGKELLPREDFYDWAKSSADYDRLYNDWVRSGYSRKLAPTVDRIDSSRGYTTDNMRWLTHSENSRLGATSKARQPQHGPDVVI